MSAITDLTLVEIADSLARRALSAVEVAQACIERAERLQPTLNCFISLDAEGALEAARRADAHLAGGNTPGPLHGVPLAHKDMYYREGVVTTCGSLIRRDFRPDRTATVIERLAAAGALHLGGLNMSEFAFGPTGHNHHYGACRNPWSPAHVTGGSSSGSGVATAARLVYGALGSDTGGSIRLPAAACGVVGIKPTQTRVSRYGAMGLSFSLDTVGPLARTVRDCARLLRVVAGHDPRDPTSSPLPVPDYEAATVAAVVRGLRIGVPDGYYHDDLAPEVEDALRASLDVFTDLGAEVVEVAIPEHEHLAELASVVMASEAATLHRAWLAERPGDYGPQVRARIEPGLGFSAVQYLSALSLRPALIERFVEAVFSRCDVLHLPAIARVLPTLAETDLGDRPGFREMLSTMTRCTRPLNYLGLPGLAVPAGFSTGGLPISFQLAGPPFAEARLFRAGAAYEAATTWTTRAPAL